MEYTANQIAELFNGEVEGNKNEIVNGLSSLEKAKTGTLSFLSNTLYTPLIYETNASVIILNKNLMLDKPVKSTCTLIRVEDAYGSFAKLLDIYYKSTQKKIGIEQPCYISKSAIYGEDCYIGAFAYLGENVKIGNNVKIYPHCFIGDNVSIGDNTTLYSGVKVYYNCIIGMDCTIHASTVIGSDGFGFAPNSENNYKKVPQIGNVVIEDFVEIGSNTSIDRATLGSTIIGKGVKMDNLIQIAHNVEIGENTILAGGVFVAGSSKIGKNVMIGGQAGVIGHIKIADGVKIAGQSGVGKNVEKEGETLQGSPAFPIGDYQRSYVLFRGLQKLNNRISNLEAEIKKNLQH